MRKYIPNCITLLNLFSGSIAVLFAVNGNMKIAALFVFLGIFFDFFDGLLARKLKVQSALGIQLDSLADMVTSGLVPGIVMYKMLSLSIEKSRSLAISEWTTTMNLEGFKLYPVALLGLFITLASAYRLAKFNISDAQDTAFIGLPTPANALLILSLPLILEFQNNDMLESLILNQWFLIATTILSCYLLNSRFKLIALKFHNFSIKKNAIKYLLIIISIIFLFVFKFLGIPLIIFTYIVLSFFNKETP